MEIFKRSDMVITSMVVPWAIGVTRTRNPEEAKKYIKHGKTLSPSYYPANQKKIIREGPDKVYTDFMNTLFDDNNIDDELSSIVGKPVYKPWDHLSGIYKIDITESLSLVAKPSGVTINNETIIMTDKYLNDINWTNEEETEVKLLATMAVWKAKLGIYHLLKSEKQVILEFDNDRWQSILRRLTEWANTIP